MENRAIIQEEAPPPGSGKGGSEYRDTLKDVLDDVARHSQRQANTPAPRSRRQMYRIAAPMLAGISFWLWVFPPTFLQPTPPPEVPVALQESGLRIEMYLQVARIQSYVTEHERLPATLEDAGEVTEGVTYVPMAGSVFRLRGEAGGVTVDYTSTEPVEDLLANAKEMVSG